MKVLKVSVGVSCLTIAYGLELLLFASAILGIVYAFTEGSILVGVLSIPFAFLVMGILYVVLGLITMPLKLLGASLLMKRD